MPVDCLEAMNTGAPGEAGGQNLSMVGCLSVMPSWLVKESLFLDFGAFWSADFVQNRKVAKVSDVDVFTAIVTLRC